MTFISIGRRITQPPFQCNICFDDRTHTDTRTYHLHRFLPCHRFTVVVVVISIELGFLCSLSLILQQKWAGNWKILGKMESLCFRDGNITDFINSRSLDVHRVCSIVGFHFLILFYFYFSELEHFFFLLHLRISVCLSWWNFGPETVKLLLFYSHLRHCSGLYDAKVC